MTKGLLNVRPFVNIFNPLIAKNGIYLLSLRLAALAALFSFKLFVGSFFIDFSLLVFSFDIAVSFYG